MPEFDVWRCFTAARTTYKAVLATSPLDDIKPPANADAHLDRIDAPNKRAAVSLVLYMDGLGKYSKKEKP